MFVAHLGVIKPMVPLEGAHWTREKCVRRNSVRLGVIAAALALLGVVASPAVADKKSEPANSGVVERFDTLGGHGVGPVLVDVGGVMLPIFVQVGWDDSIVLCTGGPPVFNGVEQDVSAPSGNVGIVVHNADVPVLVFDVSSVASEEEFIEACASGDLVPLAQGTVKQRPIINFTEDAVNFKVKSRGAVTDVTGQDWTLQAFIKVHDVFATPETEVLVEWVTLTAK